MEPFESERVLLPKDCIIAAVDTSDLVEAASLVEELSPYVGAFKLGLEFGAGLLAALLVGDEEEARLRLARARRLFGLLGDRVMWDWKFGDIPNTMAGAARGIALIAPEFVTVHASAGILGLRAAVAESRGSKVLAVTVLTSMEPITCGVVHGDSDVGGVVCALAGMAKSAGAAGIVCAPGEVIRVREELEWNAEYVCPGIRPSWAELGDQQRTRVMTPREAVRAGVTRMVVGRPITRPPPMFPSRAAAAQAIAEEIGAALT